MALVEVDDLTTFMDISFSARQEAAAELVLAGLHSELETYLRRPIEARTFFETYQVGTTLSAYPSTPFYYDLTQDMTSGESTFSLVVPPFTFYVEHAPIVSVSSLTRQGPADTSATALVEGTHFITLPYGVEIYSVYSNDLLSITYKAGLDGEDIHFFKTLILRAAVREMQNMHDDTVGVKDLTTRNVAPLETGFTEKELQSVKRYRRVRV